MLGATLGISYVELEKVSLPEIKGHLANHMVLVHSDAVHLHWLRPGRNLCDGLVLLVDDRYCQIMVDNNIIDGRVTNVFV
jgi:hypothetical protein